MKNLIKEKKAITLIALVITIVVLIILAGVLINISLGNNGLFNKAKTAKEMYTNAQNYEETEIAKYSNEIDSYVGGGREYLNVKSGTYVGDGEAGSEHPNILEFQEAPQVILISRTDSNARSKVFIQGCQMSSLSMNIRQDYGGCDYGCTLNWKDNGKTVEWYSAGNVGDQLNESGKTYKWVAVF